MPAAGWSPSATPTRFAAPSYPKRCSAESPAMKVHLGLPSSPIGAVTLTVGSFDGVHLGHVDVIRRTVAAAAADGAQAALLTFEPHPRCVLDPANCPQSITTLQEKLALVESLGIEHAIVIRFDRALSG